MTIPTQEPALAIHALRKEYGDLTALHGIDVAIQGGEFFGLLGPNGAGKTTTINIVAGLCLKTAGSVKVFGYDLVKDFRTCRRLVGLVPQEFNFDQFTQVKRILMFQGGYFGLSPTACSKRADELLELFELTDKQDTPARMLSGGMKRRLIIARALMHHPRLLILDEPTAGVDVDLRRTLWKFLHRLNETGTAILLTTHYIEEAEALCDRIAIINHGRIIVEDTTRNLVKQLGQETIIFTFTEALSPGVLEDLAAFNPEPDADGLGLRLTHDKTHTPFQQLLDLVQAAAPPLQAVRPVENPLENVFLQFTRNDPA